MGIATNYRNILINLMRDLIVSMVNVNRDLIDFRK